VARISFCTSSRACNQQALIPDKPAAWRTAKFLTVEKEYPERKAQGPPTFAEPAEVERSAF